MKFKDELTKIILKILLIFFKATLVESWMVQVIPDSNPKILYEVSFI